MHDLPPVFSLNIDVGSTALDRFLLLAVFEIDRPVECEYCSAVVDFYTWIGYDIFDRRRLGLIILERLPKFPQTRQPHMLGGRKTGQIGIEKGQEFFFVPFVKGLHLFFLQSQNLLFYLFHGFALHSSSPATLGTEDRFRKIKEIPVQCQVNCIGGFLFESCISFIKIVYLISKKKAGRPLTKIIAVTNQKGGVGKTTTTINVAASIAVAEKRTLIIDMDPQANATSGLGVNHNTIEKSIYEVLLKDEAIDDTVLSTDITYLDLIPSSIRLVGAEIELVSVMGREKVLREALGGLHKKYDYIFIDCPPSLGLLTINSLTAAKSVLIPIQCEYYALEGLSQLLRTFRLVQKNLNPKLSIEGVLLTMYDGRLNLSQQVAEDVRKFFEKKVFDTVIQRNVRLSEAPSFGKPVILYDAICAGTESYMQLAEEIINHEK
jgi:chromosome partitioning protein